MPYRRLSVVVVALGLVAAACSSSGHKAAASRRAATTAAPTTTTVPPTYPLTGLPAPDPARLGRPALVVKIENVPEARPQAGIDAADVVYEEVVEAGLSRFIVVFQSHDADTLGPVRSIRPSDPTIVKPLNPLFAYSGGTAKFINMLHAAGVVDLGVDSAAGGAYYRRGGRSAPHNLYTSTPRLYAKAPAGVGPPPKIFDFLAGGQPFAPAGAVPAVHIDAVIGVRSTATYDFDPASGTWKRAFNGTPQTVEVGVQVAPTNVIMQFVPYVISPGDFDVVHEPVTLAQVVGSGEAWVLSQGKLIKGRWTKPAPEVATSYTDVAGAPIAVPPGQTWIELAPVGSPTTVR